MSGRCCCWAGVPSGAAPACWRSALLVGSRVIAAFSGVAFHLGIRAFMDIHFHVYLPLIVLLDFPQLWQAVAARLPEGLRTRVERLLAARAGAPQPTGRSLRPAAVVGSFF